MKKIIISFIFLYGLSLNTMNNTEDEVDESRKHLTHKNIDEKVIEQKYPNKRALLNDTLKELLEYAFKKTNRSVTSTTKSKTNKKNLKSVKKKLI